MDMLFGLVVFAFSAMSLGFLYSKRAYDPTETAKPSWGRTTLAEVYLEVQRRQEYCSFFNPSSIHTYGKQRFRTTPFFKGQRNTA